MKIKYIVCCVSYCYSSVVSGKIDNTLVERVIKSNRIIVNSLAEDSGTQFYFKGKIFDMHKKGDEYYVKEWKYRRDRKKLKSFTYPVDENWAQEIIENMDERGVKYARFVDGKPENAEEEMEEIENQLNENVDVRNVNLKELLENFQTELQENNDERGEEKIDERKSSDASLKRRVVNFCRRNWPSLTTGGVTGALAIAGYLFRNSICLL